MAFKKFKNINYPVPGLDTAIQILRPGAKYELSSSADVNFIQWIDAVSYTHLTLPTIE